MNDADTTQQARYFLPPSWVVLDSVCRERLSAHDLFHGHCVELEGTLRQDALDRRVGPQDRLAGLAHFDRGLAALTRALEQRELVPLDRAAALRGSRFSLLFVELTARCNESCVHCYAESSPQRQEALDAGVLRAVTEDARNLGFTGIQLTGGDPLISPLVVPAAQQACDLGYSFIEIYTNGLALVGQLWEQLRELPLSFAFSFYSREPNVHDAITRVPGSQRRTIAAIRRTLESGMPTRVGIIVLQQNRHTVEQTIEFVRHLGVDEKAIGVSYGRAVGRGSVIVEPPPEQRQLVARDATHGGRDEDRFVGKAAVSADGTVYPCIFSRALPLGNVNRQRLGEILLEPVPLAVDPAEMMQASQTWRDQLSCWECRVRAALLRGAQAPGTTGR